MFTNRITCRSLTTFGSSKWQHGLEFYPLAQERPREHNEEKFQKVLYKLWELSTFVPRGSLRHNESTTSDDSNSPRTIYRYLSIDGTLLSPGNEREPQLNTVLNHFVRTPRHTTPIIPAYLSSYTQVNANKMKTFATFLECLATLHLVVGSSVVASTSADCSSVTCVPSTGAAHIIVSRASTEAQGPGILLNVAEAIISNCSGSDYDYNPCKSSPSSSALKEMEVDDFKNPYHFEQTYIGSSRRIIPSITAREFSFRPLISKSKEGATILCQVLKLTNIPRPAPSS